MTFSEAVEPAFATVSVTNPAAEQQTAGKPRRSATDPDTLNNAEQTFPGAFFAAHAGQHSYRTTGSVTFRSTLSSNKVNEIVSGWQWSPVDFFGDTLSGVRGSRAFEGRGNGISSALPLLRPGTDLRAVATSGERGSSAIHPRPRGIT